MLRWINDRSFAVAATIIAPITTMTVASTCSSGLGGRKVNHTAAVKARAGCDDHAELLPAELSTRTLCTSRASSRHSGGERLLTAILISETVLHNSSGMAVSGRSEASRCTLGGSLLVGPAVSTPRSGGCVD